MSTRKTASLARSQNPSRLAAKGKQGKRSSKRPPVAGGAAADRGAPDAVAARIRRVAKDRFGYAQLRPGQEQTIRLILDGHNVLSIMPTGSGKSAVYQIAALLLDGPVVVASPLLALRTD